MPTYKEGWILVEVYWKISYWDVWCIWTVEVGYKCIKECWWKKRERKFKDSFCVVLLNVSIESRRTKKEMIGKGKKNRILLHHSYYVEPGRLRKQMVCIGGMGWIGFSSVEKWKRKGVAMFDLFLTKRFNFSRKSSCNSHFDISNHVGLLVCGFPV